MRTALLIVDLQDDFLPSGSLPTPQGDEIVVPLLGFARALQKAGGLIVACQDRHGAKDPTFEPQGGPCPPHCIRGTGGLKFVDDAVDQLADAVFRKTEDNANFDSVLGGYLTAAGVERVIVAGLGMEYGVGATAFSLKTDGFEVAVPLDLTRPRYPNCAKLYIKGFAQEDIQVVSDASDLL